ncbi:glycosyl hydrolase family 43 protein [Plectosphaerella plurivora]|uniref:Glycosyl hydrolase family 43 protein n=1 Tax=Plectosphaerella plurivora TaxID=936078 RepID=A0A9P9AGB6_9PEZI|nr:glycosyl hydrolase family 43 protein [Plectosphaerella plurivora]
MVVAKAFTTSLLLSSLACARWIVPGARWRDTDGEIIHAHAGGITRDEETGRFFWFGEYKTQEQIEGGGVSVYSSDDLVTWENHGLALTPEEGHPFISPEMIIQRPKVVYSNKTGEYHMWWHADDSTYSLLLQGLATSPNITGPYTFVDATAPIGNWSQDFGMFTDRNDGRTYSLYSNGDRVEGRDVYLSVFNEEITEVESVTHRWDKYDLEAPTIIQTDKSYYAIMSHKTGYRPNNVVAFRADKLSGPWSQPFMIAPPYTRTFSSQSGFSLRIDGTKKTTYLYIGDQWDLNSIWEARYIWLPANIDDERGDLELEWHDVYDLDVETGEVTAIEGETYYAHEAEVAGGAFLQEANFASGGRIATGIAGNDSTITFTVQGSGAAQWVSFYHQNTDDMGFGDQPMGQPDRIGGKWQLRRISGVVVNGREEEIETLYQRDTHKGVIISSPLLLKLDEGENKITVSGLSNGFNNKGADLDRLVVYPPEPERPKCRKRSV